MYTTTVAAVWAPVKTQDLAGWVGAGIGVVAIAVLCVLLAGLLVELDDRFSCVGANKRGEASE